MGLLGHTATAAQIGATTPAIDTTGATLLVVAVGWFNGGSAPSINDSKGNSWTALTAHAGGNGSITLFYVLSPIVGAGHTFTVGGGASFYSCAVAAFASTSTPTFDAQNGAGSASAATIQPGSVTPAGANELFITALMTATFTGAISIDSSFVITDAELDSSANDFGTALAYLLLGTAAAQNPTWTTPGAARIAATLATFTGFAPGIIAIGAANSGNQSAVSTVTTSATWQKDFLAIDVPFMGAAGTVSTMTYGGANCTFIGAQNVVGGTGRVECWGIKGSDSGAPAAGSNTLVVTYSGVIADTSVQWTSYTGVDQTTPTEAFHGNSGINSGSATNATDVVTPTTDKCWPHWALACNQTSGVASSNTSRNVVTGAGGTGADSDSGGAISPASAQTGTFTGMGITTAWAVAGYAVRPVQAVVTNFMPQQVRVYDPNRYELSEDW
jgi:hypothetical protein